MYDYNKIAQSKTFNELVKARNQFIFPLTLFFIVATLLFPILTGYTTLLNHIAFWNISYAWLYAFLLFIMVWTLVTLYMRKAKSFDEVSEQIVLNHKRGQMNE